MARGEHVDRSLLAPQTVCVVGASGDPTRIGGRLVRYSVEAGFGGRIIPVNPGRKEVFGLPTVASLDELDAAPDWVVVALARDKVADVVEQAGRAEARNLAVHSAGFAESDAQGRRLQDWIRKRADHYGMRLLGPNTNGFMLVEQRAFFAFTPVIDSARPEPGTIAVITQSAAVGTYLINWFHRLGLGIKYWFHSGNEAGMTALDLAREVAADPEVRGLALCLETVRDPEMLRETLAVLADNDVATGLMYSGTSEAGRRASAAHTAALMTDETAVITDLCADAGAFVAPSIRELADFLQLAANRPRVVDDPRVGFVTTSGGVGILMADALSHAGIAMPTLSADLQSKILEYAPFAHPANPIDSTAQVINEPGAFERILTDTATSGELDLVAAFVAHGLAGAQDRTLRQVISVAASADTQRGAGSAATLAAVGIFAEDAGRALHEAGIPAFTEPADLARAVAGYASSILRGRAARARFDDVASADAARLAGAAGSDGQPLDEIAAKDLLSVLGINIPAGVVIDGADDAEAAAASLRAPLAAKLVSVEVPHKASVGGLELGITRAHDARAAYERLSDIGRRIVGSAGFRILLEEQVAGSELFVSAVRHPAFGVLVAVGAGGSNVEDERAVTWLWPPVTPIAADAALATAGLTSVVSQPGGRDEVIRVANTLASLLHVAPTVSTVEINPLIVSGDGSAKAADALIVNA